MLRHRQRRTSVALRSLPWQDRLAKSGQKSLVRSIQGNDAEVLRVLRKASDDLEKIIGRLPGPNIGNTVRRAQYRQIRDTIRQISDDAWSDIGTLTSENLDSVTRKAVNLNRQMMDYLIGTVPKDAKLLAAQFRSATMRSFQDVRSRLLNSIDLSKTVFNNQALTAGKIDEIVNQGILLQQSADEIAQGVVGYINPDTPGGARYAAQRLGRTELNNAYHTTSVRCYNESPHVRGVLWVLSGSHGQDDDCDELADTDEFETGAGVYPPEAVPFKPHPNCFCYTTAITMTPDQFADALLGGEF